MSLNFSSERQRKQNDSTISRSYSYSAGATFWIACASHRRKSPVSWLVRTHSPLSTNLRLTALLCKMQAVSTYKSFSKCFENINKACSPLSVTETEHILIVSLSTISPWEPSRWSTTLPPEAVTKRLWTSISC